MLLYSKKKLAIEFKWSTL